MHSDVPKQFLMLGALPVIFHSVNAFLRFDAAIQVVIGLPEDLFSPWEELCRKHSFTAAHTLSKGGKTRFETVKHALALVDDDRVVAIHDAVRPLVSAETIDRGFRDVLAFGNAVPVMPVSESLRWSEGKKNHAVDRDHLRIVQTPQVFDAALIKRAYARLREGAFTDDASVLEAMGETIHLYEGNRENIKITFETDLLVAQALVNR
jgi:2-C-methyl-D-erythritol 4-phosphate cytidylyltransferase